MKKVILAWPRLAVFTAVASLPVGTLLNAQSVSATPSVAGPAVYIRYVEAARRSLIMTDGLGVGDSTFLSFGVSSDGKSFNSESLATVTISRFSALGADSLRGPLLLSLDDSTAMTLTGVPSFEDRGPVRFEMLAAAVSLDELRRIAGAHSATGKISGKSFILSRDQLAVARILVAEMKRPVTNRSVRAEYVETAQSPRRNRSEDVFFEFQVHTPASVIASAPLVYPRVLKINHIEGRVMAQFVVRTDGTADMDTFKILSTANDLFSFAVRDALPQFRFSPAEINGKKVNQLVQQPFDFKISPPGAPTSLRH